MNRFTSLYQSLDEAAGNKVRDAALYAYFDGISSEEASWAIHLLSGGKINAGRHRIATTKELREWISELTGLPLWLVEDSYRHVGDLAETLALLVAAREGDEQHHIMPLPQGVGWRVPDASSSLTEWVQAFLLPLASESVETRKTAVQWAWLRLHGVSRLVFNKLLTGSLRVGVSRRTLQSVLARRAGLSTADMAHRMVGEWMPSPASFEALMDTSVSAQALDKPYPFFLASPLQADVVSLGDVADWQAEWKWDGIRVQLVRREGFSPYLWSRGEERLDGRFPELESKAEQLPQGVVLDGELIAWDAQTHCPRAFIALQKRIQKRKPSAKLLQEVPVRILFYDLLERDGEDWRARPLAERRQALEELISHTQADAAAGADAAADNPLLPLFALSPALSFRDWSEFKALREQAADHHAEGVMLKSLKSTYQEGRRRGDWWKWKLDPFTVDAVLIYAQSGSGRRSTLHTDYTFAVWNGDGVLVPIAKAYSGLTDAEILKLDRWIRAHTLERFGPVRSVKAEQVFEIGFEAVNRSSRHKSGVAVRFPRILRWRDDKTVQEADTLATLQSLCRE